MNLPLLLACLALVLPCAGQSVSVTILAPEVPDFEVMHRAIALRETGNRNVRGRHGEHGSTQTTTAARRYGDSRQSLARLYLIVPNPTPYRLALAWNAGPTGMNQPTKAQRAYAEQVANLYESRR